MSKIIFDEVVAYNEMIKEPQMTTPRVYYPFWINMHETRISPADAEVILLSDHKEVVEKLEATIEAFTSSYPKLERGLFLEQQLVKRQALAIEKLKFQRDIELARNSGEFMETIIENMNAEITAILQEAK